MYIDIDKARILSLNLVTKYINSLSNLDAVIFSDFFERSDSIKVDKLRMVMLEIFYRYLTSDEIGSLDEKNASLESVLNHLSYAMERNTKVSDLIWKKPSILIEKAKKITEDLQKLN